ncbi:ATP-dependent helicase [Pseudomonas aeruginosa]|nr:ATP-dependent helicase [Pseudomonas aeruginosa]
MAATVEQQAIIDHPSDYHGLVLAVAGAGKSWTMVQYVATLYERHRVPSEQIIAVMFNQAAAKEFAERLAGRLGKHAPDSKTFHGLGTMTLKLLIKAGLAPAWDFDASVPRSLSFAAKIIEPTCLRLGFKYPRIVADIFLGFIDRVKGDLKSPAEVFAQGDWDQKYSWFVEMFDHYENVRKKRGVRFFSDLIYDPIKIIEENPKAAAAVANRYRHIILDEFQDICEAQYRLVKYTAGTRARIMVVGDDDQTIYMWRGAQPNYILTDFQRDFPECKVYRLTKTWRYGHVLSMAANYVISHNTIRAPKLCISGDDTPDTVVNMDFEDSEGSAFTKIVTDWVKEGRRLSDIAVLFRTYSRSGLYQFLLLQEGIPFRMEGGDDANVLDNRWISSILGWMYLAAGNIAERPFAGEPDIGSILELRTLLLAPSLGLSRDGLDELSKQVLMYPNDMDGFVKFVQTGLKGTEGHLSEKILKRGKMWKKIRSLRDQKHQINAFNLAEQLILALEVKESIYKGAKTEDEAEEQWAVVEAFISYVKSNSKDSLVDFLKHIGDLKSFSDKAKGATDAVDMMSIHRSKGLEWPCVIMPGLNQGGFPYKPRKKLPEEQEDLRIQDERRLFYVAMTRAVQFLYMLCPPDAALIQWHRAGKSGVPPHMDYSPSIASQFLYECNLVLSKLISVSIKKDVPGLKAGNPEVYNEYLRQLGINRAVQKLESA